MAIQSDRNSDVSTHSNGRQSGPKVKNLCVTRTCDVEIFLKQNSENIRQLPVTLLDDRPVKKLRLPPDKFRLPPNKFRLPPNKFRLPPDKFRLPPNKFRLPPDKFRLPPDKFRLPPDRFRLPPDKFRRIDSVFRRINSAGSIPPSARSSVYFRT